MRRFRQMPPRECRGDSRWALSIETRRTRAGSGAEPFFHVGHLFRRQGLVEEGLEGRMSEGGFAHSSYNSGKTSFGSFCLVTALRSLERKSNLWFATVCSEMSSVSATSLFGVAADEEEFDAFDLDPVAPFSPLGDLLLDRLAQRGLLKMLPFAAPHDAAGGAAPAGRFPGTGPRGMGDERDRGTAAFAAKVVGQFVGGNRKEIAFQRTPLVEVGKARDEPDKRLLHDILGRRTYRSPDS